MWSLGDSPVHDRTTSEWMQKAKGGRWSSGLADDRLNGEPHLTNRKKKGLSSMVYELNHTVKSFQEIIKHLRL